MPGWDGVYIGARGFLCDISQPRRMMDGGLAGFQNSSGIGVFGGGVHLRPQITIVASDYYSSHLEFFPLPKGSGWDYYGVR